MRVVPGVVRLPFRLVRKVVEVILSRPVGRLEEHLGDLAPVDQKGDVLNAARFLDLVPVAPVAIAAARAVLGTAFLVVQVDLRP